MKRGVADNTVHYTAAYYETQLKQKEDTHTASVCQFSIYAKPNQTKFDILDSAFHFLLMTHNFTLHCLVLQLIPAFHN